ncbi:MAG TPA: WD40 repeat domain-containing protein, partial [Luteimonas sp.]|nr:WD40 repeat domain-containing protein [Luteimonas sp.]
LLALGYDDGRVRLLDCDTLALRDLRPAPSQRIEWIAFSADGRWLTATTLDRAFVWDVASGRGTALPARGATAFRFVEIDAGSGTVFAFGHNESGLWRLPATDDDRDAARIVDTNAQALRVHFPPRAAIPFQAIATRPALRLAASLDVDGELRIWRWREQNTLQERATAFAAHGQHFDGRHVAVAQGRVARVLAIDDSHAASPDMLHPQPVSLAALAPDGRTLVTLSGRQLRAFDWRTGRPRFAPVVLDATPLRVALSPDARIVLTGIGAYRDGRFHELLSTHDLDGRTLADGVAVPGPVAGLRFDADGRRLLLWRRRELWLHDAATLDRIGAQATVLPDTLVPAAGDRPRLQTPQASAGVQDAFLADGSDAATVITRASAYASARVADVDLSTGSILHERDLGKASAMSLLESADGPEILASQPGHPYRIDAAGRNRTLASPSGQDLMLPSAVGGDGRWLATTTASGIVLTDRRHDQWASAPLPVVLPADDALVELWFSPDASRLLARSHRGRWLWWSLDPESRPADRVSGDGAPAPAVTHAAPAAAAPAVSARAVLRARDPGAGIAAPPPHETPQQHVPQPAAATAGFAFIDLGPAINRRADTPYMVFNDSLALYTSVPAGTQRYLGIDFDIRGVVAMSMRGGGAPRGIARNLGWRSAPWRSAPVPVPVVDVEAVHLLLGACCMLQGLPAGGLYGHVVFEYVDGTEARMPIRYHLDLREPWNDPGDALPARIAWVETSPRSDVDMDLPFRLYAARFANPHPARAVARLRFEASDLAWAGPLVFAATLETARDDKPIAQRP